MWAPHLFKTHMREICGWKSCWSEKSIACLRGWRRGLRRQVWQLTLGNFGIDIPQAAALVNEEMAEVLLKFGSEGIQMLAAEHVCTDDVFFFFLWYLAVLCDIAHKNCPKLSFAVIVWSWHRQRGVSLRMKKCNEALRIVIFDVWFDHFYSHVSMMRIITKDHGGHGWEVCSTTCPVFCFLKFALTVDVIFGTIISTFVGVVFTCSDLSAFVSMASKHKAAKASLPIALARIFFQKKITENCYFVDPWSFHQVFALTPISPCLYAPSK